jgi:hypothetical protein
MSLRTFIRNLRTCTRWPWLLAPLPHEFQRQLMTPYELHVNDCSNKAGRYARALQAAGLDATVLLIRPNAAPPQDQTLHAVVSVAGLICDPTSGRVTRDLAAHGTLVATVTKDRLATDPEYA